MMLDSYSLVTVTDVKIMICWDILRQFVYVWPLVVAWLQGRRVNPPTEEVLNSLSAAFESQNIAMKQVYFSFW